MAASAKEQHNSEEKAPVKSTTKARTKNNIAEEETPYLTKRTTARAAQSGIVKAAKETMAVMGYNVIAKDGWVVKIEESGKVVERISKIPNPKKRKKTRLD